MTYAAIAIGVGSVLVLTALGEGARTWITDRFSSLGSNLLVAMPGRTETHGAAPMTAMSTRDLTLQDMEAVRRRMPGVRLAVPVVIGEATVTWERRGRQATVVGTTQDYLKIRDIPMERGTGLPEGDAERQVAVCIIGKTIGREIFGEANPLGERLRIGDGTYRVLGVIASRGQSQMANLDEMILVPVASGMKMFNQTGLFRIIIQIGATADLARAQKNLEAVLQDRHDGELDFTVLAPGAIVATLTDIIGLITMALAAIAGVSLAVAGIGVMNVMVVSVAERRAEIGLMKAVGASNRQVLLLFLAEAVVLSLLGGAMGIAGGVGVAEGARALYPDFPFHVPLWAVALATGTAGAVGVSFGILPAMRAARLDPLESLRRKA